MTEHSIVGASGSKRWLACPGSVWLSKDVKETTSEYAALGSAAHYVSECILRDGMDENEALAALELQHPDWYQIYLDDDDRDDFFDAINVYVDYAKEQMLQRPHAKVMYEQRTDLGFIHRQMFGTADLVIAEIFGELEVCDYKHGKGVVVEIEDNPQAAFYTLGIAHRFAYNFETVRNTIVQPRASHVEGGVRSYTEPMSEFRVKWVEIFRSGIERVMDAQKAKNIEHHLDPGDHCGFCPARATCPAIRQKTYELAQMDFDPITLDAGATDGAQLPDPKTLTIPQLRLVLDHAGMIDAWVKAVNEHAQNLLDANEVDTSQLGYKLVNKRPTRKYIDAGKVLTSLKRRKGIAPEEYLTEPKLLSPAQLEKKLKKNHPKVWEAMEQHIHKVSSGKTMAREDDKRPALEHKKASDDFDAIEGEAGEIEIGRK